MPAFSPACPGAKRTRYRVPMPVSVRQATIADLDTLAPLFDPAPAP
jgi:hypothetical protein